MAGRNDDESVRITSAPLGRSEDTAGRQRRYLISMAVRVVCFVSAVLFLSGWAQAIGMVAAILLPYIAVVFANSEEQRADGFDVNGAGHRELPGSSRASLQ